jgi:Tol biopolymer transport system component
MNDDGSGIVQLTTAMRAEAPAWSPDGSRIAFHSEQQAGNWDIYVMDADGGNITRLTTDPATDGFPDWSPDGTTGPGGSTPAWSPDGARIAFDSDRTGRSEIYVMDADGTGAVQVTTAGGASPDWSLDGTRIVFYAARSRNTDLYAINPDGSREVRLTSSKDAEHSPAWGP